MTPEEHFAEVTRIHALKREIDETGRAYDAGVISVTEAATRLIAIFHWLDETPASTQH